VAPREIISRNIQTLPSALTQSEEILKRAEGKRMAVFLDYDGTLTPIVERPELAILSEGMRQTLQALASLYTVGIISGRDRADVEHLVGLDSLIYAGSHGFDIAGLQGWEAHYEKGTQFLPDLDQAETELREHLGSVRGALVERKKFSIAVHYRLVGEQELDTVVAVVQMVLSHQPNLRKTEGKKVYELQPCLDWNKGKALLWVLDALPVQKGQVIPMYFGDDLTDEDAFQSLTDMGIGIVVDDSSRLTSAQYALKHPEEVECFLQLLIGSFHFRES